MSRIVFKDGLQESRPVAVVCDLDYEPALDSTSSDKIKWGKKPSNAFGLIRRLRKNKRNWRVFVEWSMDYGLARFSLNKSN